MIPIGTRCIYVGPPEPTTDWVWRKCEVVGHGPAPEDCEAAVVGDIFDTDHEIEFDDCTDADFFCYAAESDLIPIGHDPDAETRKTEREVEA
jgi:hypothetical protein